MTLTRRRFARHGLMMTAAAALLAAAPAFAQAPTGKLVLYTSQPEKDATQTVAAFKKAGDNPKYRELMQGRGTTMLNIFGAEAEAFIKKWQSTTAWLYQGAGTAKVDPGTLGIAKP